MPPKYHLMVYGCQMNEADSEVLAGMLDREGYVRASSLEEADLVLLITCAVREHAEQRIYGKLGELARLKRRKPHLILGIAGCMPQQERVASKLRQRFPEIDLIFGTHNLHEFPELLERAQESQKTVLDIWPEPGEVVENLPHRRTSSFKAWVNVTFGCNNFCSYCIVPYVRGRERSRRPEDIMQEVKDLVRQGYKEITLLGQNVNSYGRDLDLNYDFADLVTDIDRNTGIFRLRFMTSHPRDMSDKLIRAIAAGRSICEHIHLPLQAGSNEVLRRMNRGYTREQYLALVERIKTAIPDCSITTDLIVGFPGETEEDFQQTLAVVRQVEYDSAFTFAYSPREGTPAARLAEQIPEEIKKDRLYRLIEVVNEVALKRNKALEGSVEEILVEGPSKKDSQVLSGRTRTNKLVHFRGNYRPGDVIQVRITEGRTFLLWGQPQQE